MDLLLDGGRDFQIEETIPNLLDAVKEVSGHLEAKGRAVMSIVVDGESVDAEELKSDAGLKPTAEISTLEISSSDIQELVNDSLQELQEVLPELPQACHSLAEVFQGDSPTDGYDAFEKLAHIWEDVKSRELQVASVLSVTEEELVLDGKPFSEIHGELNSFLKEAVEALKNEDCVLLGDLLEYELAPRAEKEAQIVEVLQKLAEQRFG